MSEETWLIGRKVDASKKIFVATENLPFDFELFIGGQYQRRRADKAYSLLAYEKLWLQHSCEQIIVRHGSL